jgi:hypothetical protein
VAGCCDVNCTLCLGYSMSSSLMIWCVYYCCTYEFICLTDVIIYLLSLTDLPSRNSHYRKWSIIESVQNAYCLQGSRHIDTPFYLPHFHDVTLYHAYRTDWEAIMGLFRYLFLSFCRRVANTYFQFAIYMVTFLSFILN